MLNQSSVERQTKKNISNYFLLLLFSQELVENKSTLFETQTETEFIWELDLISEMIIFGSLLTTFEGSNIF